MSDMLQLVVDLRKPFALDDDKPKQYRTYV